MRERLHGGRMQCGPAWTDPPTLWTDTVSTEDSTTKRVQIPGIATDTVTAVHILKAVQYGTAHCSTAQQDMPIKLQPFAQIPPNRDEYSHKTRLTSAQHGIAIQRSAVIRHAEYMCTSAPTHCQGTGW